MHPLSPPSSPSVTPSGSRSHDPHLQDHVFVGEGLSDTFDTIDRAEMNKYLLPDQNGMISYVHSATSSALAPPSATGQPQMCSVSNMVGSGSMSSPAGLANMGSSNIANGASVSPSGSCGSVTLPSIQSVSHSRLITPSSSFTAGGSSPYYVNLSSPTHEVAMSRSPADIGQPDIVTNTGSPVGSGGSPEPTTDYVELQPSQTPKEEALPTLGTLKSSVNHFLPQNLCYSQTYPYNYSYTYPMWHS